LTSAVLLRKKQQIPCQTQVPRSGMTQVLEPSNNARQK
jgi:hypothetical protein